MTIRIVRTSTPGCFGKRGIWACKVTMAAWSSAIFTSNRFRDGEREAPSTLKRARCASRSLAFVAFEAHLAADDDRMCSAADFPATKRAITALGAEFGGIDRPFDGRIDD